MNDEIIVTGSGSTGNNVIIKCCDKIVLVDLGVKLEAILEALNYDVSNCVLSLTTHQHLDHLKYAKDIVDLAIPCYGNKDLCVKHNYCTTLPKVLNIEGFKVQHFNLIHNVPNTAFIIDTPNKIRILYCTDTETIPKRVKNVNYAIIEANYDEEYMIDNIIDGYNSKSHYENHHSLSSCISYLKEIYNPHLRGVILWHLSDTNIHAENAVKRVKEEIGLDNVVFATKGLKMPLKTMEI